MERILRLISHTVLMAHTEWLLGGDWGTSVPPVQYIQKIVRAGGCSAASFQASPFFGLQVSFSIIHGSGRAQIRGRPGNTYHVNDVRWMRGGRRGEGPHSNNILDFTIEHSNDSQDSWSSQDRQYSASLVRNSLYCLLHTSWLMGMSTSRPPDIIHVISVLPRFSCSSAFMYYTEWKPKNKKRGRPWNKASCLVVVAQWQHTGCTHQVSWVRFQAIFSLFYFPS